MTLREMRMAAGLTQWKAAELIGCSDRVISWWERGKGTPRMRWVPLIAMTYGVSTIEVLQAMMEARK